MIPWNRLVHFYPSSIIRLQIRDAGPGGVERLAGVHPPSVLPGVLHGGRSGVVANEARL